MADAGIDAAGEALVRGIGDQRDAAVEALAKAPQRVIGRSVVDDHDRDVRQHMCAYRVDARDRVVGQIPVQDDDVEREEIGSARRIRIRCHNLGFHVRPGSWALYRVCVIGRSWRQLATCDMRRTVKLK